MKIEIVDAYDRIADIRSLFHEYVLWIGIPLDFQNFEEELAALPGKYIKPHGRLYLLLADSVPAGCAALRPFDIADDGSQRCEMKRLFVRDGYKGCGLWKLLAQRIIEDARSVGYTQMLLDTFDFMEQAISLYKKLGFYEIEPYRYNPHPNVKYMKLLLAHEGIKG